MSFIRFLKDQKRVDESMKLKFPLCPSSSSFPYLFAFGVISLIISSNYALCKEELQTSNISIESHVSSMVDGCVNAITGDFIDSANDLVVVGPEPLVFERFSSSADYTSNKFCSGWRHNHDCWLKRKRVEAEKMKDPDSLQVTYVEASGRVTSYKGTYYDNLHYVRTRLIEGGSNLGLTNCGSGVISGKTNPKNNHIEYYKKGHGIVMNAPNGSQLFFNERKGHSYDLEKENKASTRALYYTYDKKHKIADIRLANSAQTTLSSLHFENKDKNHCIEITASDGQQVRYLLEKGKSVESDKKDRIGTRYLIKEVQRFGELFDAYDYIEREETGGNMISVHRKPEGRFKKITYVSENDRGLEKNDFRINQVRYLEAPIGPDNQPMISYQFHYFADSFSFDGEKTARTGHTDVFDAILNKTTYHFKDKRLTTIEKFTRQGYHLFSKEHYHWGKAGSPNAFNLLTRCIVDGAGKGLVARTFEYDDRGNISAQRHYGEITGHGQPLIWNGSYPVENDCERYTHKFTYNDIYHNLILTDTEDNGKAIHYIYRPNTDLLIRKFILDHEKIVKREFYDYDHNGVLVKVISDNGYSTEENDLSAVTLRKMTLTTPRLTAPVGVPECTEELYYDLGIGQWIPLRKICREFSLQGKLLKEDFYDANGVYGYSITRKYDVRGNVIEESDPRGHLTYKTYDLNNNLTSERKAGEFHTTRHSYDYSNRLIRTEEAHDNGSLLITTHRYNPAGHLIATVDPFGHTTEYEYNEFGQVIHIIKPAVGMADGSLKKYEVFKRYDALGNLIYQRDEEGQEVYTSYNVHGKPLNIKYPDGSQESFIYYLDGTLEKHINRNGTFALYQRDIFDHITKKELYSREGQLLSQESFVYNSLQLLSSIDAEGKKSQYRYDGAGRLIATESPGHLITHEYDSFGRLEKTHEWYDALHKKTTQLVYNPSGQIIEEKVYEEDKKFKHHYFFYDISGNVIARTEINQTGEAATTRTEYNWHKQPTKTTDALGNVTHIQYDYEATDSFGHQVLQTTLTDSLGNQSLTTHNSHGKVGCLIKKNSMGKVTAKKELFYKGNGDLYLTRETAISNNADNANKADRVICTRWNLDFFHQVRDLIEAEGTPEQKHTHFDYNKLGQKAAQTKPNGDIIHFVYDSKGRMSRQYATNGSFDYQYGYDRTDRVICIEDLINQTITKRSYNLDGQLQEEQLGNGLAFQYHYDRLDRPTEVILPDSSTIQYTYDACNLIKVERNGREFAYKEFHLVAHPKVIAFPLQAGELKIDYDLMGRAKKVQCQGLTEEVTYDCMGNLIKADIQSSLYQENNHYSYDDLYQLKSESGYANHTYQNDSLYNCIQRDGTPRTFNALHQLIQEGDIFYKYDLNGNLIYKQASGKETHYTYDALDRLLSVQTEDETTHYTYDALHRRLSKKNRDKVVRYLYQGENEVGACDEGGKIYQLRILGIGKGAEIGASLAFELDSKTFYPLHDHNGNVLELLNDEGVMQESYRYSAFGEAKIFDINGNIVVDSTVNNPWMFSSKRQDVESGLVYFGRRYYDPAACRWTTPDPLGYEAGPNLYAYVMNSPLTHIDLYGLVASKAESARTGFFGSFFSALHSGLDHIRATPGRCVERAGLHLVPIPLVSDVIRMCGRFMAGDEKLTWNSWRDYDHSENIDMPGELFSNVRLLFGNGILTVKEQAMAVVSGSGSVLNGLAVTILHGASHGLGADIIECAALILGIPTRAAYQAVEGIRAELAKLEDGQILHYMTHSQGGLVAYRALEMLTSKERERIFMTTYGSAKIIDKNKLGLAGAINNIGTKDPIPFLGDPIGYVRARFDNKYGNTNFCSGKGCHGFMDPVYQDCVRNDLNTVRKETNK